MIVLSGNAVNGENIANAAIRMLTGNFTPNNKTPELLNIPDLKPFDDGSNEMYWQPNFVFVYVDDKELEKNVRQKLVEKIPKYAEFMFHRNKKNFINHNLSITYDLGPENIAPTVYMDNKQDDDFSKRIRENNICIFFLPTAFLLNKELSRKKSMQFNVFGVFTDVTNIIGTDNITIDNDFSPVTTIKGVIKSLDFRVPIMKDDQWAKYNALNLFTERRDEFFETYFRTYNKIFGIYRERIRLDHSDEQILCRDCDSPIIEVGWRATIMFDKLEKPETIYSCYNCMQDQDAYIFSSTNLWVHNTKDPNNFKEVTEAGEVKYYDVQKILFPTKYIDVFKNPTKNIHFARITYGIMTGKTKFSEDGSLVKIETSKANYIGVETPETITTPAFKKFLSEDPGKQYYVFNTTKDKCNIPELNEFLI